MKKHCTAILVFLLVFSGTAWPEPFRESDEPTISLEQCIGLALENHPSILSAESDARSSSSRIDQQSAGFKPSVNITARHIETSGNTTTSSGISLNQLISDGGRTSASVSAARRNHDAACMNLERARQNVVYDVTAAYYAVLQAQRNVKVAEETLGLYEEQLRKARSAYDVGVVARSDVTAAIVDLGNARLGLVSASADLRRAFAVLENSMGTPELPSGYRLVEAASPEKITIDLDTAVDEAIKNRPDFASNRFQVESAEATLRLQEKSMSPELSAYAGYDWSHNGSGNDDDWQVGLSLSIPVYDGGLSRAKTEEARANLAKNLSGLDSSRMNILLEVRTALLDLEEAGEFIDVSRLLVAQARENLDLATGRYHVGVGNSLEVSQAAENYSQAQKNHNEAIYQYHLAVAGLEASLGRDLLPWAGKALLSAEETSKEVF
ncbi:MAG: TolC family protein [Thermovirgaceae bacterium]